MKFEAMQSPADKPGSGESSEQGQRILSEEEMIQAGYYKGEIYPITPEQFEQQILDGTELIALDGQRLVKGKDTFNLEETRGGYLPYGFAKEVDAPNWLDRSRSIRTTLQKLADAEQAMREADGH